MSSIKTIIVDDESRIRRRIERLVQSFGVEWEIIATYSDGKEAFDSITNQSISFDLLITDVQMPEMDGLTLIHKLKETTSFTSMIISGYDDFSYLQTAMREGAANYILKPIDKTKFAEQMEEVKGKIYKQKDEEREKTEAQEHEIKLTYAKQIQFLSEVTWNDEVDLSLIDWIELFPLGIYKLFYISVDQRTKIQIEADEFKNWDNEMEKIFKAHFEDFAEKHGYWWWRSGTLQYWLLIFNDSNITTSYENDTNHLIEKCKGSIQQATPFTVSIAVGDLFDDLLLLPNKKDQLLMLLQHRIIQGGNRIFQAELLKNEIVEQSKSVTTSIYKKVQQITSALEGKSEAETVKALQLFFQELEVLTSPTLVEEAVNYLCLQIINRWMELNGLAETPDLLPGALQLTKRAANFHQLKDGTKNWVLHMKEQLDQHKKEDADPIQRAKDWIQQHLGKNITIKKIAEHVYMSPTYFSNFFKAQTGETILDYVTKCRLEKAKELLVKTDWKVYDISTELGYQDTKYFSRLFKQWYGLSPSQYRERYFKEQ